jgi:4-alpha-glucanotransferase
LSAELIERLAGLRGIGDAYHDFRGNLHYFSLQTKIDLLRAMGCETGDPFMLESQIRAIESHKSRALLPIVAIARGRALELEVSVTAREFGSSLVWSVILEDGSQHEGVISTTALAEVWRGEIDGAWMTRRRFELPIALPQGHHDLEAKLSGGVTHRCRLIVAPQRCFRPAALREGRRLWGVAAQLYTVRSRRNWGMGDFEDLKTMIRWLAAKGAAFIALNPLHSLAPGEPQRASPYSASNRNFVNILYIAVEQAPEFHECVPARNRVSADDFATRVAELRSFDLVDYRGVADLKLQVLRLLHRHFRTEHLMRDTPRARAFKQFLQDGGDDLRQHALFDALDAHWLKVRGRGSGWQSWPAEFAQPEANPVKNFAQQHSEEIEFFLYAQWLAHEQLLQAQALARSLGMPIGLYGDCAVGAHPSGSEVWTQQNIFRLGAEIGAPPDPLALKGQGWGIPPQDPAALEAERGSPFLRLLKNNMRYYGALRFDHVMALFRQWWVPGGQSPADGAYVHYPMHMLMSMLTLESDRHRCLVIGEDLGVVPDEIRSAMPEYGLLHYKVLLFEKQDGRFRRPAEFERRALATASTHDMPTLRSYWTGGDIELRGRLNLYPDQRTRDLIAGEREHDRQLLLNALREQDLLPQFPQQTSDGFTPALAESIHVYLARSAADLAAMQIEDLLGMAEPVNVPGTHWEYPNWRRKLDADIEDVAARADIAHVLDRVNAERNAG